MPVPLPRSRAPWLLLALVAALFLAPSAMAHERGALYTQTNDPAGNTVQKFVRGADGSLTPAGTFATGGIGLATLGGRQGAVELSEDGSTLYAVNAGSDSVSAFRVGHREPKLIGTVPSGGTAPVSIDSDRSRVYVLNSGATATVAAYRRHLDGSLEALPAASRPCPAPTAPPRSRSRPTAARSSSPSAWPTASRRCRSTGPAGPARR